MADAISDVPKPKLGAGNYNQFFHMEGRGPLIDAIVTGGGIRSHTQFLFCF